MNRPNAAALAVSGLAAGFSIGCKRRRHVGRGGPAAVPAPHRLAGGAHVSRRLPRPGAGTLRAARARQSRSPTPVGATGRLVIPVPFRGRKRQADLGQLPRVRGQTPGLPRWRPEAVVDRANASAGAGAVERPGRGRGDVRGRDRQAAEGRARAGGSGWPRGVALNAVQPKVLEHLLGTGPAQAPIPCAVPREVPASHGGGSARPDSEDRSVPALRTLCPRSLTPAGIRQHDDRIIT